MNSPRRWWIIGNEAYTCKQEEGEPLMFPTPQVEVVEASDYDTAQLRIMQLEQHLEILINDIQSMGQELYELQSPLVKEVLEVGDLVVNDLDGLTYTISYIEPRSKPGAYSHLLGNIVGLVDLYGNETEVYEWEVTILDNE